MWRRTEDKDSSAAFREPCGRNRSLCPQPSFPWNLLASMLFPRRQAASSLFGLRSPAAVRDRRAPIEIAQRFELSPGGRRRFPYHIDKTDRPASSLLHLAAVEQVGDRLPQRENLSHFQESWGDCGKCKSKPSRVSRIIWETARLRNHLWSEGMMYQGAHSVLQRESAAS